MPGRFLILIGVVIVATVTHQFVSAIPDGADTTVARPSDWNAAHTVIVSASGMILGRLSAGAGAVEEIPYRVSISVYKSADESVSNTTLQSDDALTVNLLASTIYRYTFRLFENSAGAAEGLKLALSGTVGVTSMKAQISIYDDTTNALAAFARVIALNSSVGAGLSMGDNRAIVEGTIETSTAGTLVLSWAQNGGAGANPTTIQRGSNLVVEAL